MRARFRDSRIVWSFLIRRYYENQSIPKPISSIKLELTFPAWRCPRTLGRMSPACIVIFVISHWGCPDTRQVVTNATKLSFPTWSFSDDRREGKVKVQVVYPNVELFRLLGRRARQGGDFFRLTLILLCGFVCLRRCPTSRKLPDRCFLFVVSENTLLPRRPAQPSHDESDRAISKTLDAFRRSMTGGSAWIVLTWAAAPWLRHFKLFWRRGSVAGIRRGFRDLSFRSFCAGWSSLYIAGNG